MTAEIVSLDARAVQATVGVVSRAARRTSGARRHAVTGAWATC